VWAKFLVISVEMEFLNTRRRALGAGTLSIISDAEALRGR